MHTPTFIILSIAFCAVMYFCLRALGKGMREEDENYLRNRDHEKESE